VKSLGLLPLDRPKVISWVEPKFPASLASPSHRLEPCGAPKDSTLARVTELSTLPNAHCA